MAATGAAAQGKSGQSGATPAAEPTSAELMRMASEICLRNYRSSSEIPAALEEAGFTLVPGMDEGVSELTGPRIFGWVAPNENYCSFQAQDVSLDDTMAMGRSLADTLFPGMVQEGHPERGLASPCDGLSIFAPQSLIWVHYSAAGNSGECNVDGTSAILLSM
ncbi:hypothetical protein [Psychromarinibacter sp. S121]|uniref:hypothetical protein n=1 Tax=Psychromarinibacter sp. S121 TaxID=3415127 RepID=UPI003C7DD963